ncbi:MAG: hypothetical protein BGO77_05800 [Caedibacter sp. 37-49]|nr:MAG: hypothetical protein BGO77_05800 [Caedibacter sp. 37-49]
MLHVKERILLNQPYLAWILRSLEVPGNNLYPFRPEITVEITTLPESFMMIQLIGWLCCKFEVKI